MDEIIKKLISIDKQARVRVSKAKKERAKAIEDVDKRRTELKEKNEEEFKKVVAMKNAQAEKELASAKSSIEENKKQAIEKLETLYNENCDEWVNKIVEAVTC